MTRATSSPMTETVIDDATRATSSPMTETVKATIVIERQPDGKMRVTSGSWDGEKVFSRDQVLEVRNVDGRLHIARKPRHHDEWDLPIAPYDPTGRASMSSLMTDSTSGSWDGEKVFSRDAGNMRGRRERYGHSGPSPTSYVQ